MVVTQFRSESDKANHEFKKLDFNIINNGYTRKEIAAVRTRYRTTFTRWAAKEEELSRYEEEHSIDTRWLPGSDSYMATQTLLVERSYRRAVDSLERLVVQRLFELTKLGMNGVGKSMLFMLSLGCIDRRLGYKLREKISKALQTRSGAIKTALQQYNDAAAKLNPPRDPLTWSTVLKAATVADFDLLRDTRTDIRCLPWTEPSRREATTYYFGIKRAREEIVRLNVEITRLLTFMFDTHIDYYHAVQRYIIEDPPLAHSLSQQWQYQDRINESVVCKLVQTSQLRGFTGKLSIGSRIGRDASFRSGIPPPHWASHIQSESMIEVSFGNKEGPEVELAVDEDDIPRQINVDTDLVVQLIERLSTSNDT
jgi:hypothetical protein